MVVNGGNGGRVEANVIGQKDGLALLDRVPPDHPAEEALVVGSRLLGEHDHLICANIRVRRSGPILQRHPRGVLLEPGDEMDAAGRQMCEPVVLGVAPVEDEYRAGRKLKLAGDLDVGNLAFGDDGELRQLSVVVEEEMDFDGTFGGAVLGPVEDLGTEVDDGAVQTIELAGDQQRGLSLGGKFGAEMAQQTKEQILIDSPWAVSVGLGQRPVFGSLVDAEMDKFAFARLEAFVDFA